MHLQSWRVVCFLLFISQQTSFLFRQIDVHIIVTVITIFDIKLVISFINFTLSVAIWTFLLSRKCKCNAGVLNRAYFQDLRLKKQTQVSFYNLGVNNKDWVTERLLGHLIRDWLSPKLEEFKFVKVKKEIQKFYKKKTEGDLYFVQQRVHRKHFIKSNCSAYKYLISGYQNHL